MRDVETKYQAAVTAEDEPKPTETEQRDEDAEAREVRELRAKIGLGDYAVAAIEKRAVEGAAAEYNAALKIGAHRFPLQLLAPEEERATTNTDTRVTPSRWLDRLFAEAAARRLGITFESVDPGVASYPVTTAGASGAQRGRSEAAADAAWTIGTTELKPTRNAVRAVFSTEDALRNPGLQNALERDLRMALMDAVDKTVFLGDDGANENSADITGLTGAAITEQTITQTNKVKGPETLTAFTGLVDGIHAMSLGDLRVVAAVGAWRLWESTVINSAADNMTLAAFLRGAGLSWSARGDIETATANGDFGAFVGRGRGIEGAGLAAVWRDGMLITDPYTGAAKGEIALTMNYQWAFGLPRAANFARVKFVT